MECMCDEARRLLDGTDLQLAFYIFSSPPPQVPFIASEFTTCRKIDVLHYCI